MGHGFIDHCSRLDSPIHRLDARVKILAALFFLILLVTIPPQSLFSFVIFGGILVWAVAFSRVPLGRLLLRASAVLPFSALTAFSLPFFRGGAVVDVAGLSLSVHGLWMLWGVVIKSTLSAAALALLAATTPFAEVLSGLRRLGVPVFLVDMMALTYRYIFLLVEEAVRLRHAAVARGYAPRWLPQALIVGRLIGNLFLRSYERAERVYGAMRLRGYDGHMPSDSCIHWRTKEICGLLGLVALLTCFRFFVS